jgi:hypothetical protein
MNRSVRRVMVGVAGLAVLGMTATLAGAQTDAVKESRGCTGTTRTGCFRGPTGVT